MKTIHKQTCSPPRSFTRCFHVAHCAAATCRPPNRAGTIPEFHPNSASVRSKAISTPMIFEQSRPVPRRPPGSIAYALDVETAKDTFALRDTPRFALAAADFDLH